ncbi:DUF4367 domain-containing protein [Clostridium merdae]|uniref:DUF4367 domain-containing protein n=1 Tax=Clostridium merdae TaxID=1958780 RepID=UPI000A270000|nr:DUF4367 domain-containing protein [Clostridium merdae]
MKKRIAILLCAVLAFSFTACTQEKPEAKDDPQKNSSTQQIPNPWVDCQTIADAEKLAGFTVLVPKSIPDGYTEDAIQAIKDSTVQIIYKNGEAQIVYRQGRGTEDISGVYTEYKENSTLEIGDLTVAVKGNDGKIYLATWKYGDDSFSIYANSESKGMDRQTMSEMIRSINANAASSDNVKTPNPFAPAKTLEDTEKLALFSVTLPEKMPEGYSQKSIDGIEKELIQFTFSNGENSIVMRKAKGSEDISGDYNEYSEKKTLTVGDVSVAIKGKDGMVNVATWVNDKFSYSITADKGLDTKTLGYLVNGFH